MKKLLLLLFISLNACNPVTTSGVDQPAINGVSPSPSNQNAVNQDSVNGQTYISVNPSNVKSVAFEPNQKTIDINQGNVILGGAIVTYESGPTDNFATYSSSDDSTLQVVDKLTGSFIPLKAGVVKVIAASTKDPNMKAELTVTITDDMAVSQSPTPVAEENLMLSN